MALYIIDDETKEAVYATQEQYNNWCGNACEEDRLFAKHAVIERDGYVLAIDAVRKNPRNCKILAIVVTRFKPYTEGDKPPWETFEEGDTPDTFASTRAQAKINHARLVNKLVMQNGGRFIIR